MQEIQTQFQKFLENHPRATIAQVEEFLQIAIKDNPKDAARCLRDYFQMCDQIAHDKHYFGK